LPGAIHERSITGRPRIPPTATHRSRRIRFPVPIAYLGLGTNLGDRGENLRRALRALRRVGTIEAISSVYESEPVGYRDQPDFWNMAVRIRTGLSPHALLAAVKSIECELGRVPSFRNAPRPIDVDILLYDERVVSGPDLAIPHPRLLERVFAMRPLVELDPEVRHPCTGRRIRDHLTEAPALERAEPIFTGERFVESDQELD